MARHGIPTASFRTFDDPQAARDYIRQRRGPLVVKADGLAAGKGVTVAADVDEALRAVDAAMVDLAFGESGRRIVIEERLVGREVSAHAFTDGVAVLHMPFACDYKRIFDGDRGPNTGGMGVYSPPPWLGGQIAEGIRAEVTEAAVRAMRAEGRPYQGVLYPGMMVTASEPMVVEFNCRFGDPEAQGLLPRLKSDLLDIIWAVVNGRLHEVQAAWSDEACVGVVLASGGYPGEYRIGFSIYGLEDVDPDVMVFHAGTRLADDDQTVLTAGGRVLTVAATGPTLAAARAKAYDNVARIRFEGMHYRRDIAHGMS
jgi:phosphoribosylamine--glycine ligase